MHMFFSFVLGLTLLGVLGVLAAGMIGIARGDDARRSNKLMQWRVGLQALAILLLGLLMLSMRH
ncbi:MAG: twin transmembrane helix small protein [Proteobacteria bacterium]|nr:twin transmembrane helix small protein [Pseudomonadota bacterium]